MKNILLAIIFVIALSSVEATAQIFIPRPPVVNIPVVNPAAMQIRNQVFRNMINGAQKGGTKSARKYPSAAGAGDFTMFKPRQENYLPKLLAQAGKGSADEQRQTEQFFNSQIELYEYIASDHGYPANDVAFALVCFIGHNYEFYYDLWDMENYKNPWAKRARNNAKQSMKITPEHDRAMYDQFKELLSAKTEFKKMTDKQKQELTETLAIMHGIAYTAYNKSIEDEDEELHQQARDLAKNNIEEVLGIPINKIKFTLSGLEIQ